MANNYLQFSEVLAGLTPAEVATAKAYLEDPTKEHDFQYKFKKDASCADGNVNLWIYAEECGEPANVADFVQEILAAHRPNDVWCMTWANTCSSARVGEFSGGAVVVTAKNMHFMDTSDWIRKMQEEIKKSR